MYFVLSIYLYIYLWQYFNEMYHVKKIFLFFLFCLFIGDGRRSITWWAADRHMLLRPNFQTLDVWVRRREERKGKERRVIGLSFFRISAFLDTTLPFILWWRFLLSWPLTPRPPTPSRHYFQLFVVLDLVLITSLITEECLLATFSIKRTHREEETVL